MALAGHLRPTARRISNPESGITKARDRDGLKMGSVGLLRNPIHVTLNEVKGLLTLVESSSRRFFAALRMTRGGFFNSPSVLVILRLNSAAAQVSQARPERGLVLQHLVMLAVATQPRQNRLA